MDWNTIINTFGFPIACVCACAWFIWQMYSNSTKENASREERNYQMLGKFQVSIDAFSKILETYEGRLGNIERDVKEIKEVVHK